MDKTFKKVFKIEVTTKEGDFAFSDLAEALGDGIENVGNYTLVNVREI